MYHKLIPSTLCVLAIATTSHAGLEYSWVKTATAQTTDPSIYPGQFDTWEFQLSSKDESVAFGGGAKNYNALSLNFASSTGAFLTTGGTTFKSGSANPILSGFTAPDCFFVLPAGATQLAATQVDLATILESDFTTSHGVTLVPISGVPTTVAVFSVPTGTTLSMAGIFFVGGTGIAGEPDVIIPQRLPEPSTLVLFGLALAPCCSFSRNR